MSTLRKSSPWKRFRKLMNDIHLWLGLASGIIVFIICLTGTIYVFNTEIREWSRSNEHFIDAGETKLSLEKLSSLVIAESGGKLSSIKIPRDPERSYTVTVRIPEIESTKVEARPKPAAGGGPQGKSEGPPPSKSVQYLVNPYTGKILGNNKEKNSTENFMGYMFSLHRWLLLDKIEEPIFGELPNRKLGSYISGAATILFTLGVITGMIIWFPQRVRSWRQGLKIKWSASWKRINHDIHNSLGFYSCILLFLMGITGPQWSFPWYRDALRKTLGTYQSAEAPTPEDPQSNSANANRSISYSEFLLHAEQVTGYHGNQIISLPADSLGVVEVSSTKTGFFAPAASDRIKLDQFNNSLIKAEIFKAKPLNERISSSIKALHLGDVYGTFSKILYFLACLIATSLPITGTLIWLNKMKK